MKFVKNLCLRREKKLKQESSRRCQSDANLKTTALVPDAEINEAKMYFIIGKQALLETCTKIFQRKLIIYTGHILPSDDITIVGKATKIRKDLTSTSFCVPLTDKDSPVAYSLVNDIH